MKKNIFIPSIHNCVEWGFYKKLHGFKGELVVEITHKDTPGEKKVEALFVNVDGAPVPFINEAFRYVSDRDAIVKHEGIDSHEAASFFLDRAVLLPNYMVKVSPLDNVGALAGFVLTDLASGRVGAVTGVEEMPGHPLLTVMMDGEEKSIPLVEELIVNIDFNKKTISANLPEGLLDL